MYLKDKIKLKKIYQFDINNYNGKNLSTTRTFFGYFYRDRQYF